MAASNSPDSILTEAAAAGDRHCFGELVSRHQTAACSIAYAICGDFAASEDIAQEAFVAAWKQLAQLRDRTAFRSWVCGIARQLACGHVRRNQRRRETGGAALEDQTDASVPAPHETAVSREEAELLWRSLDALPELYREPLVLFYREQQSVRAVSSALGISEETAKQRLSRGRALLRDLIASTLEGALTRTRPSPGFTASVLGSLPVGTAAAGAGAGAGKLAMQGAVKSGAGVLSAMGLGTVVSCAVGVSGLYLFYRVCTAGSVPPAFRRVMRRLALAQLVQLGVTGAVVALSLWRQGAFVAGLGLNPPTVLAVSIALGVAVNLVLTFMVLRFVSGPGAPLAEFGFGAPVGAIRYESRASFLGLPLVAVAIGPFSPGDLRGVARGWIAIGTVATGGLFACGGLAAAPIAVGGVSVGLLPVGGLAFGGLAVGGIGVGYLACAGVAVAWRVALGGLALAVRLAIGGVAAAGDFALSAASADPAAHQAGWSAVQRDPVALTMLKLAPSAGWLALLAVPGLIVALNRFRRS